MMLPESQGMWPAFWMLGNNITINSWPACGEADIMEHIDGSNPPINGNAPGFDWIASSVQAAPASTAAVPYTTTGFSAAAWHTYGMIWTKGQVQFYVDIPPTSTRPSRPPTSPAPGPSIRDRMFIILNLAVGGDWPGSPDCHHRLPLNHARRLRPHLHQLTCHPEVVRSANGEGPRVCFVFWLSSLERAQPDI